MRPRLIASDLDGTFLGAEAKPHPANIKAAQEIIDAGIEFVVATGRPRRWLQPIAELRALDPLVIANNGASVGRLSAERPEITHPIQVDLMHEFLQRLPRELEPTIAVEYELGWAREPDYPTAHDDEEHLIGDIEEILSAEPVLKLLARTEHVDTDSWADIAVAAAGDLECTFSWSDTAGTVELAGPGVSKGTSLAELLRMRGISPTEVAAFGDMPNDLTMLQLVGYPFVMAGAHLSLLDHGFTQIGHHHEGAVGEQILTWLHTPS